MSAWKEKDLSYASKEILIKSVARALPNYIMSVFKLSGGLCEDLMKCIRAYWWGSEKGRRKVQWIPWSKLIKSKGAGGMGFRDLNLVNQALLAKQAWRLVTFPDSLCLQVLTAKYYPTGNLLDMAPAGAASQTWRAIEHGLELLKKGVIWRVGDGRSIIVWRDNWIPKPYGLKPVGSMRLCRLRRVEHLIDWGSRSWDEAMVRRYFYLCDAMEILKIKISANESGDLLAWNYEKSGLFSVHSAYRLALHLNDGRGGTGSSSNPDGERALWKKLWAVEVSAKVRVHAWKVVNNGLPTRANKCYRHLDEERRWELCGWETEDCFHTVVGCPHARTLGTAGGRRVGALGARLVAPTDGQVRCSNLCKFPLANLAVLECQEWGAQSG